MCRDSRCFMGFSRMRSRRVPVLRLGSRGSGGDASRCVCGRKRPRRVGHAGETKIVAKRRTVVPFYVSYYKSVNSHRDQGGVVVAKRRTVVTFGLVSGLRVSKVSTVTGIAGGPRRETQNRRHFWPCLWREERREERGEKRDERREERREERRGEWIEERREERRGDRR